MSMVRWLDTLTEEYIVGWANKGLVRRGKKLLNSEDIQTWSVQKNSVDANIQDFHQNLNGDGFDALSCSCPAKAQCHHLTCFLCGLTTMDWLSESQTDGRFEQLTPWLLADEDERINQLSKPSILRASKWINAGLEVELEETDKALVGIVRDKYDCKVYIPRTENLRAASCSCKKEKCVHLAAVVLRQSMAQDAFELVPVEHLLDDQQVALITRVKTWLNQVVMQGVGAISSLHIAQGIALATELRQADFPAPEKQLLQITYYLQEELDRQLISSIGRIRKAMVRLFATLSALQTEPLPQTYNRLAGEHRRQYVKRSLLTLHHICNSLWQTDSGYGGYSIYFYCAAKQSFYTWSEARNRAIDSDWSAQDALEEVLIDGVGITGLKNKLVSIKDCWVSKDGRLSVREGTKIELSVGYSPPSLLKQQQVRQELVNWLQTLKSNPFGVEQQSLALIAVTELGEIKFDQYRQHWHAAGRTEGVDFHLRLPGDRNGKIARQKIKQKANILGFFGRWGFEEKGLIFFPLALFTAKHIVSLSVS